MRPSFLRTFFFMMIAVSVFVVATVGLIVRYMPISPIAGRALMGIPSFWVVDAQGNVLESTTKEPLPFPWSSFPRPEADQDFHFRDGATPSNAVSVMRSGARPDRFFVYRRLPRPLFKALLNGALLFLPFIALITFFGAWYLYRYSARQSLAVRRVINQFRNGNLKARFRIERLDEAGVLMQAFNEMAAEIEGLVETLKGAEKSRTELLRSLAHDLRTPLTSICFLIETVAEEGHRLPKAKVKQKMQTAAQEMAYFRRLLEDLFMLSNLNDPLFAPEAIPIDLREELERDIAQLRELREAVTGKVAFELAAEGDEAVVVSGDPVLLKRMFRNALDNAGSFARRKVWVRVSADEERATVEIRDDGPGFTREGIEEFGLKHHSRTLDTSATGRISLGLGSVILRRIATHYGGRVEASNWEKPDGKTGGARLLIVLPLSSRSAEKLAA